MRWQVSRVTVRKALDALTRENLLTRVSGKGTFVSGEKFQRSMTGIMSFSELCQSQDVARGHAPSNPFLNR